MRATEFGIKKLEARDKPAEELLKDLDKNYEQMMTVAHKFLAIADNLKWKIEFLRMEIQTQAKNE